ncbi:Aro80p KNAG_0C03250 [Huiozyma naganishii CBS 8797]|uniref:Zn(2)-C6 fungal-type domain-containing protein n=1 Tax=Huiozyma naganishii (strain ATCC MYA-139 / BCRC 22969 / CBS 8797 / KCTC 17520 / NBRC 10181 / NCYC 3082 / Yp74L-3) TaxID=1071383 RepID=J7S4R8_HUIN7|nr:hypothetical protein KNAG_0C03250 [Kazachstania naganishii CBS 8797]CCK69434.1 hypothetical protein KNAG_0C03250 [Kazachstania naganishii CBS 8797]
MTGNGKNMRGKAVGPQTHWIRGFKACTNCRIKKVRCDFGPSDNPHPPPCARCKRESKNCTFTAKTGKEQDMVTGEATNGIPTVDTVPVKKNELALPALAVTVSPGLIQNRSEMGNEANPNTGWKLELTSMHNTLAFLAQAAGTVSNTLNKGLMKKTLPSDRSTPSLEISRLGSKTPTGFASSLGLGMPSNPTKTLLQEIETQNKVQLIEKSKNTKSKVPKTLKDIKCIGENGLLSEQEATAFIDAFFCTMHPFFPYIPLQLQDPLELLEYPILLCAILTISTRYHSFSEFGFDNGDYNKRNFEVHEKLWDNCQVMLSKTIWGEASTRSIGTVLAFILFTEWNPRQIHWKKSDYANDDDEAVSELSNDEAEELTGTKAIRRSDRMAWMLTGSAVRLAQDMGFMETNAKVCVATHISDAFASMNMNQKPVLSGNFNVLQGGTNNYTSDPLNSSGSSHESTCSEQAFMKQMLENTNSHTRWRHILSSLQMEDLFQRQRNEYSNDLSDLEREFLNDEFILYYSLERRSDNQETPPFPLQFSYAQKAKIELTNIMLLGYDTIYYDRGRKKLASNNQLHNLSVLSILSPLMEGWHNVYKNLLIAPSANPYTTTTRGDKRAMYELSKNIDSESIICDYRYSQLYIYSLALQADFKRAELTVSEITQNAKYVEIAFNAAKEIIFSAFRVHKLNLLKYMPVRWVMRLVRAVSFLVKCCLILNATSIGGGGSSEAEVRTILKLCSISVKDTANTIKMAAMTLKEATPDELHLSMRYSAILLYLCRELESEKDSSKKIPFPNNATTKYAISPTYEGRDGEIAAGSAGGCANTAHITANRLRTVPLSDINETTGRNTEDTANNNIVNGSLNGDRNHLGTTEGTGAASQSTTDRLTGSLPDEVTNWFSGNAEIGLEFVEPWTDMIEQRFLQSGTGNDVFEELYQYFDQN